MRIRLLATALCTIACVLGSRLVADDSPTPSGRLNPYLAPAGLSVEQLVERVEKMGSKPRSIQARPGFNEAVLDLAERILSSDARTDDAAALAMLAKLDALSAIADSGNAKRADELIALANSNVEHARPEVARQALYYVLCERAARAGDNQEEIAAALAEIEIFFSDGPPEKRHERLASDAVRLINDLKDQGQAAEAYVKFGGLFAKSSDKTLAKYGREVQGLGSRLGLVGRPIELAGTTLDGTPFDITSYRGKLVLVDFWATWCGPCVAELPNVKQAYAKFHDRGFEIVGVSLDTDRAALEEFIARQQIPWTNLLDEAQGGGHPLAEKFGVQAIPSTLLVDREGKVIAKDLRGEGLIAELAKQFPEVP